MPPPTPRQLAALHPADREWYEERAAILEYDGGLPRRLAEQHAYVAVQARARARWEAHDA